MKVEGSTDNKEMEILIVEDSPTQAEELKYILEKNHLHDSVANNGKEALVMLAERKPSLVLSDIVMPEMDGYELCKLIKMNDNLRNIPVILVTSLSDPKDVTKALECGADNFITKPYDEKSLLSRIQHINTHTQLQHTRSTEEPLEISIAGESYHITTGRVQILDLLLSTYELAIQRNEDLAKTQEELQQRILEMYSLNTLTKQVSENLSLDQVVRATLEGIMSPVAPDLALLFVSEGDNLLLKGYQSSDPKFCHEETPVHRPGECLCGLAVKEGKPVYSYDINNDHRCTWEECKKAGLRSFAALPLMTGGNMIGVLGLASGTMKRDFSKQANFLETLANGITIGLQNAFLYEEVKQNEVELTKMNEDLKTENTERKRIEEKVAEHTVRLSEANASLEEKNRELERFNNVFVARELRIKELRDRIKKLEEEMRVRSG